LSNFNRWRIDKLLYTALIIVHVVVCIALILIVLLQTGRGAEMGAAFGGASQTLFGGSGGSTFMSKLTTGAAIVFMVTCLTLSYWAGGLKTKSIMENIPAKEQQGPVLPAPKPVQPAPEQQGAAGTPAQPQPSPAPAAKSNPAPSAAAPAHEQAPAQKPAPSQK
jgi:preprotein translocase subunit SecG